MRTNTPETGLLRSTLRGFFVFAVAAAASYTFVSATTDAEPQPAAAHNSDNYYEKPFVSVRNVRLGNLQANLDGAGELDLTFARLYWSKIDWNAVPNANFSFTNYHFYAPKRYMDRLHLHHINMGATTIVTYNMSSLARTTWCGGGSSVIESSAIRLDFRSWDNDGNTVISPNFDVESLMVHELGHAAGMGYPPTNGHFNTGACPGATNTSQQTMCPYYTHGQIYWRTLESHDKHTFAGFY